MARPPWMAMVALAEAKLPPVEEIVGTLCAAWGDDVAADEISQAGNVVTFRLGEAVVGLVLFPMPIPWERLEGPCACAWYWPQAADQMRRHQSHILVTLLDEYGQPQAQSMALTKLVSSVARCSNAIGVYWGPGRLVHSAYAFWEMAGELTADELPLYLWIDFRVEQEPAGTLRLFTTGLEPFGHAELEVRDYRGTAEDLRVHVFSIAHYLLERKKTIADGERIGLSDEVQVTARHAPSMIDPQQEVVALEF